MSHPQRTIPNRSRGRANRSAGFSLVELSVAIALSAVVMLALGSAMVLASRALPNADSPALASHDVGRALEQLSTDLQHALYVSERSPHAITFTVADRTGDGSPQRMRYAWSGEPGEPLTWQLDDHDPVDLLPSIDTFELSYEQQGYTRTHAGHAVEGIQTLVSSHPRPSSSSDRETSSITSSSWLGQIIRPDIPTADPDNVLYWQPTYAAYVASRPLLLPPSHWVRLVVPELDHRPSETVLAHYTQSAGLLGTSLSWRDAPFSDAPMLMPGQPVNLIIRSSNAGGTSAFVEYDINALPTGGRLRTTNGQHAWESVENNRALIHALYAIPYTVGPSQSLTRHHLTRVHVSVRATGEQHPRFNTAVHLPNRPGVFTAYWEADFRHDPTALDVNADGEPDWSVGTSSFATNNLDPNAGTWQAQQTLRTWPNHDFTEPTVVRLQLRHTSADGGAALMRLYADRRNGRVGPVGVYVHRQSDGRQTLDLISRDAFANTVTLLSLPDQPPGFLDVRLAVLPAHRSINIDVNGVNRGTYQYHRVDASNESRAVELLGWQTSHAEFKHVRITVGGGS
ncbi:type II secretion system protein J [Phycisphaerales bacterium AB-hyl4]|uniref:Type II secretion system protein J n=1 Tax=Natronomicrosphaera hydrolytica TaxID=3242702 RepID=A0ABV4U188_9BACT